MRLDELKGRRVALFGLGADVRAAVDEVVAAGPAELFVVDESPAGAPIPALVDASTVTSVEAADLAEVFVRSPGFPRYRPELVSALSRGAAMTTPVDLWMGTVGPSRTVVAVTGTKGKSTVTDLIGSLARNVGLRVGITGNLGPPVFGRDWDHAAPVVVIEVSSYQAADLHHVPDVAVLTFLSEDHLTWHGSLRRYVDDKLRVLTNDGGTAPRILVASQAGTAQAALSERGLVAEVVEPPAAGPLVPAHRLQNAALAAAVVDLVGGSQIEPSAVVEAARSSLPGRLDACPGPMGILCIDDALASNPSATAAGLTWLRELGRPTIVLIGGDDRGVDPGPLADEAAHWPGGRLRAVALPANGAELGRRCGIDVMAEVGDVAEAVHVAISSSPHDGVVLFSPAAPTPAGHGNWETRSSEFRAALIRS